VAAQPGAGSRRPAPGRQAGYHRQIADRNVEAILDAADELLRRDRHPSMSGVAARAGLSRVTLYAHFPTWENLLEAAVERAVRRVMKALEAARPDEGPPVEALDRLLAAAWQHLAGYSAMAQAVAESLSPEAVARTHHAAYETIGALLERGLTDGSFRTDVPAQWLATASLALIHACSDAVRAGQIDERHASRILRVSIRDLFTGTGRS